MIESQFAVLLGAFDADSAKIVQRTLEFLGESAMKFKHVAECDYFEPYPLVYF